jgi:hypothetical protein
MEAAGYRLAADYDLVDRQHFQMFSRTDLAQATALLPPWGALPTPSTRHIDIHF